MIDIINTVEAFERLRPEWEDLERNPSLRIFQTYVWCKSAWDCYVSKESAARLWILRWHQDGKEDVVIFPLYIDGKGCLRFIMDTHSDVCDSVHRLHANRHIAYKEAADCIVSNKRIKCVWLQKMRGESEAMHYFGVFLPAAIIYKDNAYSWISSDKSEDFIRWQPQLRSKDKADLKAIKRKADKYELCVYGAGGEPFPEELIHIFRSEMLNNTKREIVFLPNELIAFSQKIYESGIADIVVMKDNGHPVALNFLLKKDDRFLSWIFLYTDPRSSTSMYVKLLSEFAKAKAFVFDFGVGVYSYKIGTFRPETEVLFSLRCGFSPWQHIRCAIAMNFRFAKDYLTIILKKH